MRFHLSLRSGVPIYVQLVSQIRQMISSGRLPVGAELPTIRALAEELLINPNTVARAYKELENRGFLTSRRGIGTTVAEHGSSLDRKERASILNDRIDTLLAEAERLGFRFEQLMERIEAQHQTRTHDDIMREDLDGE